MEEVAGEIQSEKATPSTHCWLQMEEGATSQCRRPLEAGKPCDSQQGNSELSPQTQRTNYAKKVNEKGNRLFPRASRNECTSFHFSMVTSDYRTIK